MRRLNYNDINNLPSISQTSGPPLSPVHESIPPAIYPAHTMFSVIDHLYSRLHVKSSTIGTRADFKWALSRSINARKGNTLIKAS